MIISPRQIVESLSSVLSIKRLILLTAVMMALTVWMLRQNNLTMVELRNEVIRLDRETGDINKVTPAVEKLGNYVLSHMNTNMGTPLELPGTYNSAVEKIRRKAEATGSANSAIYAEAQRVCEDPSVLLTVRAQCMQDYITANAKPGSVPEDLKFPDKALYSYNFASPAWSADLAGLSLLASVILLASCFGVFGHMFFMPALLRWIDKDPLE
jgi:hypothetical protein